MFSLCASTLLTHSVLPGIVAPETIIVKGVLNTINSDRQDFDFFYFLGWHSCCNIFAVKLFQMS